MARRKTHKKDTRRHKKNKKHTMRRRRHGGNNGVYVGTSKLFTENELKACKLSAEGCNPQD